MRSSVISYLTKVAPFEKTPQIILQHYSLSQGIQAIQDLYWYNSN